MRFGLLFKPQVIIIVVSFVGIVVIVTTFIFQERSSDLRSRAASKTNTQQSEGTKNNTVATPEESNVASAETTIIPTRSSRTVAIGMWTEGFWDDSAKILHPERLQALEAQVGKKMAIAHYYRGWHELDSESFLSTLRVIDSYGWRPMVSANPYFFDRCQSSGLSLYQAIASGNCDAFLQEVGRNLVRFGKPVFLRFAWEMNISSMEWEIRRTGGTPNDFINAWRHFHDILQQEGAKNVLWIFSPNVLTGETIPYGQMYPGNNYVDWVALDGYNWGSTQPWSKWQSFHEVFYQSYLAITSIAPVKPIMLAEVNSTNVGGDKAAWYKDMLKVQLPTFFPKIQAVVFYNEDRTSQENVNWLIDISADSLKTFKDGLQNPIYTSTF